jgi:hypothetical protein
MINQEKMKKQENLGVFCIGLLLGVIVCYIIIISLPITRLKVDEEVN